MKARQRIIPWLLVGLLLTHSFFVTIRRRQGEERLHRVRAAYEELRSRHRNFAASVSTTDPSMEAYALLKLDALRESMGTPSTIVLEETDDSQSRRNNRP